MPINAGAGHYEEHLRRVLAHTSLRQIQWVNKKLYAPPAKSTAEK